MNNSDERYVIVRSRLNSAVFLFMAPLFPSAFLLLPREGLSGGTTATGMVASVAFLFLGLRAFVGGIFETPAGLLLRGQFGSRMIPWKEIAYFQQRWTGVWAVTHGKSLIMLQSVSPVGEEGARIIQLLEEARARHDASI